MADEPVAVVEGPKGKAEIFEVMGDNKITEYQVKMAEKMQQASSGALDPWSPAFNSEVGVRALDAFGTDLHVGGDFSLVNGSPRRGYAQFTDLLV